MARSYSRTMHSNETAMIDKDTRPTGLLMDGTIPKLALRIGEAASALSISRSKMYGLIKAGKVGSVLVGDVMRVRVCDLEKYLEAAEIGKIKSA